ncbi:hypothetical protein Gbth_039_015 [Gluconobacter thailandicus F149-1 = NBRC 100600]|nr:hypothetical protein [Gluconobacter thailandicus]KXV54666.1 hypothetical protein AD946_02015 [Gluconobacter thailandicus]GAN93884.1 hypothetical protein Gbth_039_015 [Gluconobacter thailandicus F149-1 = NBRC 100600]GBR60402.1 hypothetical protein AA100600_1978 [Gluconobacter thailandicus F149-1 = NBRC 100600]GEL88434.1 hypothetical protein GTH01_27920 [Gluconobacter thailandicus F149-1 = NBRC 100600]
MTFVRPGFNDHEGTGSKDERVDLGEVFVRGVRQVNVMEARHSDFAAERADQVFTFLAVELGLKALMLRAALLLCSMREGPLGFQDPLIW